MAGELRVGLIGTGGVAAKYAALYGEYPRCRLLAVHDPIETATAELTSRFGASAFPAAEALIESPLDAIVISTPNRFHHAQTKAALRAGKHVLLQKPMTLDVAEAEDLVATARAAGKVLALYMSSLDHPLVHDLRRMAREGVLGRVGGFEARLANGMGHVWREPPAGFWRGSRAATGGGCFAMLATHYLNLGPWLLDSPIVEVAADGANLMCPHIEGEDHMVALVRFANGARGSIGSSWCVKGEYMSVHGAQGFASYVDNAVFTLRTAERFEGEIVRYGTPGERLVLADLRPPAMGDWRNPRNQHRRFVDVLLDGGTPDMPGEAGLRDMKTLAAAYRALAGGGREKVAA